MNRFGIGIVGVILKGAVRPASHLEHQGDGEQEQVDVASQGQGHVESPVPMRITGLPVCEHIHVTGKTEPQRAAETDAQADLHGS